MTAIDMTRGRRVLAVMGVMLALLLASLDQTIVGTALPRIVAELHGLDYYSWVVTAYLVASTVVIPVAGKLGDMFGRKPFLLTGMIGFVAASALCGLSQDMAQLVVFRGLQGLFGGLLFAMVFTVLADIFPVEQRARMQGLFGGVFGLSSIIGPTIGGWLTDGAGWRWVFYVNVPVGILAVTAATLGLPAVRSRANWRNIDFFGAASLTVGLVPLLVALSITNKHSWTSPEVLGLLGFATLMLVVFWVREQRAEEPIVPFSLFRTNVFAVVTLIAFFSAFGMFGSILFVPLLYQGVLGASATTSGQLLTPMMVGLILFSIISGQLITRITRYRFIGTAGMGLMILGLVLLAGIGPGSSQLEATRDIVIVGAGLGLTFPLTLNAVQSALPRSMLGVGSSQVQFWRNLGGTVGSAVLGSILSARLPSAITAHVAALQLPPQFQLPATGTGSAQTLFDPARIAQMRASLPPAAVPLFDRFLDAIRLALADTLHDMFMYAAALVAIALVATLFLREVPIRTSSRQPAFAEIPAEDEAAVARAV